MVRTFGKALSPLLFTNYFAGLGLCSIHHYPKQSTVYYIAHIYSVLFWAIFFYLFANVSSVIFDKNGDLPYKLIVVMSIVTTVASVVLDIYNCHRVKACLIKLAKVDDTLEELGTAKEYQRLYSWMLGTIVVWVAMGVTLNLADIYWWGDELFEIQTVYEHFVRNYCLHINTLIDVTFGTVILYTGTRFEKVNEHLHRLLAVNSFGTVERSFGQDMWNNRNALKSERSSRTIWTAMHLHLELCRISGNFNEAFTWQMTLEMGSYFVNFVGLIFYLYEDIVYQELLSEKLRGIIPPIVWGTVYFVKFISINYICETTSSKANETKDLVYRLVDCADDTASKQEMTQFIFQLMRQPLRFTGAGFFYFGYDFIRGFLGRLVTVLVIMMQMQ